MLLTWGANSYGQLGLGLKCELVAEPKQIPQAELPHFRNITTSVGGGGHTLFLYEDGSVFSCGWNNKGQLGLEEETTTLKQITLLSNHKIIDVACGWDFSAALTEDKKLFVWGSNAFGQLGLAKEIKCTNTPQLLKLPNVTRVSCGLRHMAVLTEGKIVVFGNNSKSQLGVVKSSKTLVDGVEGWRVDLNNIIDISCGQYHTLALDDSGTLYGWGNNKHGQLGVDPKIRPDSKEPIKIITILDAIKVECGWTHNLLLTKTGKVYNWGRNNYGQLGESRIKFWVPTKVTLPYVVSISAGSEHSLAVTDNGVLLTWGWNEHGNCGTGDTNDVLKPKGILTDVIFIGSGCGFSFAFANT